MQPEAQRQFAELEREHWWFRGRRRVYLELLRAALGSVRVPRALDLGGGAGGFSEALGDAAERVVRVDLDAEALRLAQERRAGPCAVADARRLPFRARSFDLVALFDVLEHVPEEARALAEVRRVTRPGGLIVLSVPAYAWLYANNDRVAGHVRRYTRARLRRALEAGGLRVERVTHTNVALFPAIAPAVLLLKLAERLRLVPRRSQHTNLSLPAPRWLSALLYRVFAAELWLSRRFDLPVGHSILALARRPTAERTRRVRPRRRAPGEPRAPLPGSPQADQPSPADRPDAQRAE